MTLKDQLMADFKDAMKAKDGVKKNTISLARAAIKQYEIDNNMRDEGLDDEGVLTILTKQVKMRRDALAEFEEAGRTDLLESYRQEIEVLMAYLPKQLTAEDIMKIVEETASQMNIEGGKENMGKLMGPVMGKVKGLADGNMVRSVVMQFLS